jgi:hypothetical protein
VAWGRKTKKGVACGEGRQPLSKYLSPSPNMLIFEARSISLFGEGDTGGEVNKHPLTKYVTKVAYSILIMII